MIKSLTVKNFAIIDNMTIDFFDGMSIITGQTGAGKSLIIDAIGLLFGDRSSVELIRHNESKASIEGVFINYNKNINNLLKENEIDIEDDLTISRSIYSNGKSVIRINSSIVNLNTLAEIGFELGNIHTQFDTVKLINPKNYYDFIEVNSDLLNSYQEVFNEYKIINLDYLSKLKSATLENQKLDFLKYQVDELEKANLSLTEEEQLLKALKIVQNSEKISNSYQQFINLFDDNSLLDKLRQASEVLEKLKEFNDFNTHVLDESYYNILDVYETVKEAFRDYDFSGLNNIDIINDRLGVYSLLKRKYKLNTEDLISYLEKIKEEVNLIENYDFYLNEITTKRNKLITRLDELSGLITKKRQENALILIDKLKEEFNQLSLKNTTLEIKITKSDTYLSNGVDLVDILVSFNKGEPLKPLGKVASGGELSRFMLALKSITATNIDCKTFIFDEIDSGVSGEIAYQIALKIKSISNKHQVLCITHLPQVASIATKHLKIIKRVEDDLTKTNAIYLNMEERIEEISKMISNGNITSASTTLAKELLNKN